MILCPYYPEVAPEKTGGTGTVSVDYWDAILDKCLAGGATTSGLTIDGFDSIELWLDFQTNWTVTTKGLPLFKNNSKHAAKIKVNSRWGDRSPSTSAGDNDQNRRFASATKAMYPDMRVMQFPSANDERPNQSTFWESDHLENLHQTWLNAIGSGGTTGLYPIAEYVQIPTADDFAEGAMYLPTRNCGWVKGDVGLYYLIKWKTGKFPTIKRDAFYLTHRIQITDTGRTSRTAASTNNTYTGIDANGVSRGVQTTYMTKNSGLAVQDTIAVYAFLTGSCSVTVKIGTGTNKRTFTATMTPPAGDDKLVRITVPVANSGANTIDNGYIGVTATRSNEEICNIPQTGTQPGIIQPGEFFRMRSTLPAQDYAYRMRAGGQIDLTSRPSYI